MADETTPTPRDGKPEQGTGETKPAEVAPYELEPAPPAPMAPPVPPPPSSSAAAPGKLSDKGLTDDFPEDADFSHDPEVDRALKGDKAETKAPDDTVDEVLKERPPFVRTGMGGAKNVALIGTGLAIAAVIAAFANTTSSRFPAAVLALYFVLIHTVTGVGAVVAAAQLNEQPLGPLELAAARMLVCVSLFLTLMNLHVTSYHIVEPIFASLAYWLALTVLFRVTTGRLAMVAVIHMGLAIVVWLGMVIYTWAAPVVKA